MSNGFRSICVFCGARDGRRPAYLAAARSLGEIIGRTGGRLVYGAGDVGMMGTVADAARAAGARTLGVIPVHLMGRERAAESLAAAAADDRHDIVITETMHERKKVMFMNSDAIAVLPGGAGTLDEFFEVLTWRQLGLHAKPVWLINTEGYWSPLVTLIGQAISEGFADPSLAGFVEVIDDVESLAARLAPVEG